jgi:hypothetical protein
MVAENSVAEVADIVGHWKVEALILDGVRQPPFNPDLVLEFDFFPDGRSRLLWYRNDEDGFCEREGHYVFDGEHLSDEVTWVNPNNRRDCGSDPDMRLGRKTVTRAQLHNGNELWVYFPVAERELIYVWVKQLD